MRILFWLCVCVFFSHSAKADLRFERFLPENPTADSEVQVEIWFSGRTTAICDFPLALAFEDVALNGNIIRAQVVTARLPSETGVLCSSAGPSGPITRSYRLGRFPAGNYTVQLVGRDGNSPTRPLIQIATVPLTIAAGSLVQVPAVSSIGMSTLLLGLLIFGLLRLRDNAE